MCSKRREHGAFRRRNLKSQIQSDARRVFLSENDFAVRTRIRYWRYGNTKPPIEMNIPIVISEDANMNAVWNRNKNIQRIGNDQVLYQMEMIFFCAREDFNPPPKKNRKIQFDSDHIYEVLGTDTQGGMLRVEVRELEE